MRSKKITNDVTLSIRLPRGLNEMLEIVAKGTDRSRNYIVREAIARYVQTESDIVAGIHTALSELDSDSTIPHEAIMKRARTMTHITKR